jgi:hypothetical protein
MKTWYAIILTAFLGLGSGLALAMIRIHVGAWDGTAGGVHRAHEDADAHAQGQPRVVVDREVYDFGEMDGQTTGTHQFLLKNSGDAPLTLKKGGTTCKCTLSELDRTELPPGESTAVTLTWTPRAMTGEFRQTATILTNDPARRRLELAVSGRVITALWCSPAELVITKVPAGETVSAMVQLFCGRPQPAKIIGFEMADPRTADNFAVTIKAMPSERVAEEAGAKTGHLIEVTVKPGLPPRPFQQTIRIKTDVAPVEIPVRGTVTAGMAIAGRGWNDDLGVLMLGTVSSRRGFERTYRIVVGGRHRKEVRFTLVKVEPELLQVDLGEAVDNGITMETPITIRIPKGSPPADYLGSEKAKPGVITLETSHPDAPTWKIPVQFAVEN